MSQFKGQGRKADHSTPPRRSVRALLTHKVPTSGISSEIAFQDKRERHALWVESSKLSVKIHTLCCEVDPDIAVSLAASTKQFKPALHHLLPKE